MAASLDRDMYRQPMHYRAQSIPLPELRRLELVAFVNDIVIAVEAGSTPHQVACAVDDLLERVGAELEFEERLMRASGYPGLVEHEGAHRRYAHELACVASAYLVDREAALVAPVLRCVQHWLYDHAPDHDSRLASFLFTAQR